MNLTRTKHETRTEREMNPITYQIRTQTRTMNPDMNKYEPDMNPTRTQTPTRH